MRKSVAVLLAWGALSMGLGPIQSRAVDRGMGSLQSMASPAGTGSAQSRLVVAPSGRVVLSWLEPRGRGGHLLRMAWLDGKRWSTPSTIAEGDSFFANWADFPSVLPLDDRRLVAHWLWKVSGDTYGYHVRTARSSDGGRSWSTPVTLHEDKTPTEHGFVSLASTAEGGMAVWLDGRNFQGHSEEEVPGPDMMVRGSRITISGVTDEQEIDPRACDCCQTAAVAIPNGVLVAYRDRSPEEIRDISLSRFEGGRWSAPYRLHADGWSIRGCPVNGPALAAMENNVVVAWFTAANDTAKVNVAFSVDAGRSFGGPIRVDLGQPSGRVGIALLPDRTALVTWLEGGGDEASIRMRRVSRTGEKGEAIIVTRTSTARASGVPQIVVSGERAILAWTEATKPSRVRVAAVGFGKPIAPMHR